MNDGFSIVYQYRSGGKIGADGNIANLSKYQKVVIHYLAVNGSTDVYTIHKKTNFSQSTIQVSMKRLHELHLVTLLNPGKSEKGGVKNTYSLTLPGLAVTIDLLLPEINTYPASDFEKTIHNWRNLCPDVFEKWDFLISQKDCNCSDYRPIFGLVSLNTSVENYLVPILYGPAQLLYCGCLREYKTDDKLQKEFQEVFGERLTTFLVTLIELSNEDDEDFKYCFCILKKNKKIWIDVQDRIQRVEEHYRKRVKKLTDMKAKIAKMW